jgi:hypothetical protein
MKSIVIFIIYLVFDESFFGAALAQVAPAAGIVTVNSISSDLTFKVWSEESFESNREVVINYSVKNDSDFVYKMINVDGIYDTSIILTGPDGKKIVGYHEKNDSSIIRGVFKRFQTETISPQEEDLGDPIPLSLYWPLESAGEYRCVVMKTIYKVQSSGKDRFSSLHPGIPVLLTSPEIKFRINSVDKNYTSPAAAMILNQIDPSKSKDERSSEIGYVFEFNIINIFMIGLVAILGSYLGVSLWRRRQSNS